MICKHETHSTFAHLGPHNLRPVISFGVAVLGTRLRGWGKGRFKTLLYALSRLEAWLVQSLLYSLRYKDVLVTFPWKPFSCIKDVEGVVYTQAGRLHIFRGFPCAEGILR